MEQIRPQQSQIGGKTMQSKSLSGYAWNVNSNGGVTGIVVAILTKSNMGLTALPVKKPHPRACFKFAARIGELKQACTTAAM